MLTDPSQQDREFGIGGQVVIKLSIDYNKHLNARVYIDNFSAPWNLLYIYTNKTLVHWGQSEKIG
jgi:hypothetical protein